MDTLRVMIVDDEPLARLRLRGLLADCRQPGARVVADATGAPEVLHRLSTQPVELVLMDVCMPGLDGLQLAERLRDLARPPKVVFVSAHDSHALRAFDLDAVDYLTKPVALARLQQALRRAADRIAPAWAPRALTCAEPPPAGPALVVSHHGRLRRVPVAEVLYLKAELKYVTLRCAARAYVLEDSLADLERRLAGRMLRVHRNALVAPDAIARLERRPERVPGGGTGDGWAVQIGATGEWLAVSRRLLATVRMAIAGEGV